jgi:hypothetical protein
MDFINRIRQSILLYQFFITVKIISELDSSESFSQLAASGLNECVIFLFVAEDAPLTNYQIDLPGKHANYASATSLIRATNLLCVTTCEYINCKASVGMCDTMWLCEWFHMLTQENKTIEGRHYASITCSMRLKLQMVRFSQYATEYSAYQLSVSLMSRKERKSWSNMVSTIMPTNPHAIGCFLIDDNRLAIADI